MQNLKLSEPFDHDPPHNLADAGKVFSVSKKVISSLKVIEPILMQGAKMKALMDEMEHKNLMDQLREGLTPHGLSSFRTDFKPPTEFFDDQPLPKNGVIAYGGCFSNHFQ